MRVLIAGVGNIFLGDDGFGVEVARRLQAVALPLGTKVADVGIRTVHLAFDLASGEYEAVILVDATPRGGAPGSLYVIEPQISSMTVSSGAASDPHGMTPTALVASVAQLGGSPPRHIRVVGCEPDSVEEAIGLSPAVEAAVPDAVVLVQRLVDEMSRTAA